MNAGDVPTEAWNTDGAFMRVDWPDAAEAVREATFRRLHALILERDLVPEDVLASARSSFVLRSVDDELASLVYDSKIDDQLLAGVRSGSRSVRQLTFAARALVLEIEISEDGHLVGQVVPPQAVVIELRHRSGTIPVKTDELGWFQVPAIPDGPVSFRCRPVRSSEESVATSWITL
jgi:hypothetical protein